MVGSLRFGGVGFIDPMPSTPLGLHYDYRT